MISFLKDLFHFDIKTLNILNRENSDSYKNKTKNHIGDIIFGNKYESQLEKLSGNNRLSFVFAIKQDSENNTFEFRVLVVNNGKKNIKNLWANCFLTLPKTHYGLSETASNNVNILMNNFGQGISANLKNDFIFSPRMAIDFLYFKIPKSSILNANQDNFKLEFSFGSDISKIIEFESEWSKAEFEKASINSTKEFLKFIKSKSNIREY